MIDSMSLACLTLFDEEGCSSSPHSWEVRFLVRFNLDSLLALAPLRA